MAPTTQVQSKCFLQCKALAIMCGGGAASTVKSRDYKDATDLVVATFQNTGQGWWNESDIGATLRTPCGGDSNKANLVVAIDCRNATESAEVFHTLQSKPGGGQSLNCTPCVRLGSIVRRLTPLECERLQGYPDTWTNIGPWTDSTGKLHKDCSDSPRYQALGNSIALPAWAYVLTRLSLCVGTERPTMASLFDGIGGLSANLGMAQRKRHLPLGE